MTQTQAITAIDARLRRADDSVYRLRVIHGYHGGTVLRDAVGTLKRNHTHLHAHTFTHTHDGTTHTHTITHEHDHGHYLTDDRHGHRHSLAELESAAKHGTN